MRNSLKSAIAAKIVLAVSTFAAFGQNAVQVNLGHTMSAPATPIAQNVQLPVASAPIMPQMKIVDVTNQFRHVDAKSQQVTPASHFVILHPFTYALASNDRKQ